MCILFCISNGNPNQGNFKLILASNRDEFYERPTLSAAAWSENEFIYGGRDALPGKEGGSWLAIGTLHNNIKLGALLNITGEIKSKITLGRGPLVSNYVCCSLTNAEYCNEILNTKIPYDAFNFITIEIRDNLSSTIHCSNVEPKAIHNCMENKPLAFGNSPTHLQLAKVKEGKQRFKNILHQYEYEQKQLQLPLKLLKENLINNLLNLLKCKNKYWPDEELKKRSPIWGEHLSSINVSVPLAEYGTRTHTIILIDQNNQMDFYEETMVTNDPHGEWKKTHIQKHV